MRTWVKTPMGRMLKVGGAAKVVYEIQKVTYKYSI